MRVAERVTNALVPAGPRAEVRVASATMATLPVLDAAPLGAVLDDFLSHADVAAALRADPLELVRQTPDVAEREVVALLTASLAFGQVAVIKRTVKAVLRALGPSPTKTLRDEDATALFERLTPLQYRWLTTDVLARYLAGVGRLLREDGTLARSFGAGLSDDDADVGPALAKFGAKLGAAIPGRSSPAMQFLLPNPQGGAACKRMCLMLRWLARPDDGVDLGLWTRPAPRQLVMPLDTHVARIARYLGLTRRRTAGWAMALEVTAALRALAPEDPLRYDFALCHLGVSGQCQHRRVEAICAGCGLNPVCRLTARGTIRRR